MRELLRENGYYLSGVRRYDVFTAVERGAGALPDFEPPISREQFSPIAAETELAEADRVGRVWDSFPIRNGNVLLVCHLQVDELAVDRLHALVNELSRVTDEVFPNARKVLVTTVPESDVETEACHHIAISVFLPADTDVGAAVQAVARIHGVAATFLGTGELRAVRISVDPHFGA